MFKTHLKSSFKEASIMKEEGEGGRGRLGEPINGRNSEEEDKRRNRNVPSIERI